MMDTPCVKLEKLPIEVEPEPARLFAKLYVVSSGGNNTDPPPPPRATYAPPKADTSAAPLPELARMRTVVPLDTAAASPALSSKTSEPAGPLDATATA
jgi:hypothetical protein